MARKTSTGGLTKADGGRSRLGLALLVLASGCASEQVLIERGTPKITEQSSPTGSPYVLQSSVREDGVHVALTRASCPTKLETPVTERTQKSDPQTLRYGAELTAASLVLGGLSYGFYQKSQSESGVNTCTTDSSGGQNCSNKGKDSMDIARGAAVLGGLAFAIGVPMMIFGKPTVTTSEPITHTEHGAGLARSCASPLKDVVVTLLLRDGQTSDSHTNGKGEAVIALDDQMLVEHEAQPLAIVEVAGRHSGKVDLTPLITAARPRWNNAQRLAGKIKPLEDREGVARADAAAVWSGLFRGEEHAGIPTTSCAANGTDTCNDAIDNDCDGRYDNDCGYSTGVLQWTLAWNGTEDLDLHVIGPDGREVYWQHPRNPPTKLTLDRDCRGLVNGQADCPNGNIENVFVPANQEPVAGTYRAWVQVANTNGSSGSTPITATLGGRTGAKTWKGQFQLAPTQGAVYQLAYVVGPDEDGDGVGDAQDVCPKEPGRWSDDRLASGCPDNDSDGVPDSIDACPQVVGLTQASDAAHNGCPLVMGSARVTNLGVEITSTIEFDIGKATLRPSATHILNDVVSAIHALPTGVTRLGVDGHTDAQGNDSENVALSQRRAQTVVDYFSTHGVTRNILLARGFGQTRPIADNDSQPGRQKNRRVELRVLEPRPKTADPWDAVKPG